MRSLWLVVAFALCGSADAVAGFKYMLIVDAGSTGSRLRMFNTTLPNTIQPITPKVADDAKFQTTPGLSAFADSPRLVGPYLAVLLTAALPYIPIADRPLTLLFVKATAGMRLLPPERQEAVLWAARAYLSDPQKSPFHFAYAETISGEEEAVYGYVAINALLGRLQPNATQVGMLDLGGASTQVTFQPEQDIRDHEFQFYLQEERRSVYAKSYIRYGINEAILRAITTQLSIATPEAASMEFPCFPLDYSEVMIIGDRQVNVTGTGQPSACSALAYSLLHEDYECLMPPCAVMGTHMTPLTGEFFAIDAFFFIVNGLGLVGPDEAKAVSPHAIEEAADGFCRLGASAAAAAAGTTVGHAKDYCFGAYFVRHLLQTYGFEDDSHAVTFTRKIDGHNADWTYGAALFEAEMLEDNVPELPCRNRSSIPKYTLIIDAGSSGSRLRMFKDNGTALLAVSPSAEDEDAFETRPGLSSYASQPERAGPSLSGLLQAALRYIPEEDRRQAQLFVKATAGMRLLTPEDSEAVFAAVRDFLSDPANCPFNLVSAEVISGEEEAVMAYIGINKLLSQSLDGEGWVGTLDLGGASTQIVFQSIQDILDHEFQFYLDTRRQKAFASSYIRFGQDQAKLRSMEFLLRDAPADATTINHPCFFPDYSEVRTVLGRSVNFTGPADNAACSKLAASLMHMDYECLMGRCSVMGTPISTPSGKFLAFSAFFYVAQGLGLVGMNEAKALRPSQIEAASANMCASQSLAEATAVANTTAEFAKDYCFSGHFMRHLLGAHGFEGDSEAVTFARKVAGHSADWTYGAALYETQYMPMSLASRGPRCDSHRAAKSLLSRGRSRKSRYAGVPAVAASQPLVFV